MPILIAVSDEQLQILVSQSRGDALTPEEQLIELEDLLERNEIEEWEVAVIIRDRCRRK